MEETENEPPKRLPYWSESTKIGNTKYFEISIRCSTERKTGSRIYGCHINTELTEKGKDLLYLLKDRTDEIVPNIYAASPLLETKEDAIKLLNDAKLFEKVMEIGNAADIALRYKVLEYADVLRKLNEKGDALGTSLGFGVMVRKAIKEALNIEWQPEFMEKKYITRLKELIKELNFMLREKDKEQIKLEL